MRLLCQVKGGKDSGVLFKSWQKEKGFSIVVQILPNEEWIQDCCLNLAKRRRDSGLLFKSCQKQHGLCLPQAGKNGVIQILTGAQNVQI